MRERKRGKTTARFTFGLTEPKRQRKKRAILLSLHYLTIPSYPVIPMRGLPRRRRLQGPLAGSSTFLALSATAIQYFILPLFHPLSGPLFGACTISCSDVWGVAIYRFLVDGSSDAQMRRSTLSPHRPRLQQLAGSASRPFLCPVDRRSDRTRSPATRSAYRQSDVWRGISALSLIILFRFLSGLIRGLELTGHFDHLHLFVILFFPWFSSFRPAFSYFSIYRLSF